MGNLYTAHAQFSRPDDEHFHTVENLVAHLEKYANPEAHYEDVIDLGNAEIHELSNKISMMGYALNDWSSKQLCQMVGAPHSYIKNLSMDLAIRCLNEGIDNLDEEKEVKLYKNQRTGVLRAINGTNYGRVYDLDVAKRFLKFKQDSGWYEPPDWNKQPQGAYYGDQDMYMILISGGSFVLDDGSDQGLNFGIQSKHSEVGKAARDESIVGFRGICGNLIMWDAQYILRSRSRHSKNFPTRFYQTSEFDTNFVEYLPQLGPAIQLMIDNARKFRLEWDSDVDKHVDYLKKLTDSRQLQLTKPVIREARELALNEEGGVENLWQFTNGLTALARSRKNYSDRADLQSKAGKLLALAA